MQIANLTKHTELASNASAASSFWQRLVGLLGRRSLPAGEALLLQPCRSVHTLFMRFAIDLVYVDTQMTVVKTVHGLRPFRVSGALRRAHAVIELPAGALLRSRTAVGDQLAVGTATGD